MDNAVWVLFERMAEEQPVRHPDMPAHCGRSG